MNMTINEFIQHIKPHKYKRQLEGIPTISEGLIRSIIAGELEGIVNKLSPDTIRSYVITHKRGSYEILNDFVTSNPTVDVFSYDLPVQYKLVYMHTIMSDPRVRDMLMYKFTKYHIKLNT